MLYNYWVGQKVHSGLSVRWYGRNPNEFFGQASINKVPSVQFSCSVVSDSVTPWTAAHQASLSFTISQSLLKFMKINNWIKTPLKCDQSCQLLSHVQLFATPWVAAHQASLSIPNSQSSPKLMCIELVMPSSHLILCHLLLLLPSIFPIIRVFSNESALHIRWPKYWGFSFSISPSNECSVLISFRIDWFDLHAVQGTLKSLLQIHSPKASIL